jgi:hypothetical protein
MKRREFLKTSLTASTLAGLSTATLRAAAAPAGGNREIYEWRIYRQKADGKADLLQTYLEKAAVPTWNRLGIKSVGVFVQQERAGQPGNTEVRDASAVHVLLPYSSAEAFAAITAQFNSDEQCQKLGAEYLGVNKDHAAFDRIDSWLLLAFAGMPKMELPAYSVDKKPRMFEIRRYESYSEPKALKKIDMFNSGEMDVMRETKLAPVFYGQALIGADLPHLTYMLSAENTDDHKAHWGVFGKHPKWNSMQKDPQYADTVSRIKNWFVVPTPYSQI